jgi:hypothetical protein
MSGYVSKQWDIGRQGGTTPFFQLIILDFHSKKSLNLSHPFQKDFISSLKHKNFQIITTRMD